MEPEASDTIATRIINHETNFMSSKKGSFSVFGRELSARLRAPADSMVYWTYMIIGGVFCGGFGVLLAVYEAIVMSPCSNWEAVKTGLVTYAPALAGAAAVQMLLDQEEQPHFRALALLSAIFVVAFCWIASDSRVEGVVTQFLAAIATLIALLLFWLASAENVRLNPSVNDSSMGGPIPEFPPAQNSPIPAHDGVAA